MSHEMSLFIGCCFLGLFAIKILAIIVIGLDVLINGYDNDRT